jgi:hypothetical protein
MRYSKFVTKLVKKIYQTRPNRILLRQLRTVVLMIMILIYVLIAPNSYAIIPDHAKIRDIIGPNDMSIRRGSNQEPVDINTVLRQFLDILYLPGVNRTFAQLDFFNESNQPMNLAIQASTRNQGVTLYYLPCVVQAGDSAVIEWKNPRDGRSACDRGIRIRPGQSLRAQFSPAAQNNFYALQHLKQRTYNQRANRGFQQFCSVVGESGRGWLNLQNSRNPCQEPLQQCQSSGEKTCSALTLDRWATRESNLTTVISCANGQVFTGQASGEQMPTLLDQLWKQAQSQRAKSCDVNVFGANEAIVAPLPTSERTLVQVNNTNPCLNFELIQGAAMVKSTRKPEGVELQPGQRYVYCEPTIEDRIETFNPKVESIEVQVFLARERGYEFCDRQQASGGQEGDKRTIQLTATEGEIRLDYEMYAVPDRLQIIYEDRSLLDTGFVSGSNSVRIPFKGNSGQVTVILTGNQESAGTQWNYTLYCPH